jgi:hypothetical protein
MSLNDPFFDAWVRDKLQHAEARPPDHLWDAIRRGSYFYIVADRSRYFLVVLLLLLVTGGIAYWAFHPITPPAADTIALQRSGRVMPGVVTGEAAHSNAGAGAVRSLASAEVTRSPANPDASSNAVAEAITTTFATPAETDATAASENSLDHAPATAGSAAPPAETAPTPADIVPTQKDGDLAIPFMMNAAALDAAAIHHTPTRGNALTANAATAPAAPTVLLRERRHTYLEVYAGPDHNTHYITAADPAYKYYVHQARSMEMGYPSFSFGVRADMPLWSNNWRLKLGVHYAQINEQLNYFNPSATKTVSQITMRSLVQPSGAVILVADTTSVNVKGQYVKQSLNAYRQIDIPVIASYTFLHTQQFQMAGSAGAFFNVVSWYNGDILDTTFMPAALHGGTDNTASTWKKHLGASLYGSLSLRNQLTSRIQASLEPYLRYELGTVNKDVQVYKEHFVTTGIAIGLEFALGK